MGKCIPCHHLDKDEIAISVGADPSTALELAQVPAMPR